MVIRLKVPIEMHYTVIPMGTSKVNSSPHRYRQEMNKTQVGKMHTLWSIDSQENS